MYSEIENAAKNESLRRETKFENRNTGKNVFPFFSARCRHCENFIVCKIRQDLNFHETTKKNARLLQNKRSTKTKALQKLNIFFHQV